MRMAEANQTGRGFAKRETLKAMSTSLRRTCLILFINNKLRKNQRPKTGQIGQSSLHIDMFGEVKGVYKAISRNR